eukprot:10946964-Alexandrium_andersonii.AAC.1
MWVARTMSCPVALHVHLRGPERICVLSCVAASSSCLCLRATCRCSVGRCTAHACTPCSASRSFNFA